MEDTETLLAGAASVVINNELGSIIQGAGVDQRVRAIHDDLEANALFLDDGTTQVLLISCDLAGVETPRVLAYTAAMSEACGVAADAILIGCSHTHAGPSVIRTSHTKPIDDAYLDRLGEWLIGLARDAVANAAPARLGWGCGTARLGYQRRVCYEDGSHSMYRRPGHGAYTGVEGPEDLGHLALGILGADNRLRAVLHHGTGHPAGYYGSDVLSSEYPGVARKLLRDAYGPLPVLFFNGALGDQAMHQQLHPQASRGSREEQAIRLGASLAGETMRILHELRPEPCPRLQHRRIGMDMSVRLPSDEVVAKGREVLARIDAGEDIRGMEAIFAFGPVHLVERFGQNPVDRIAVHALMIGGLAIVTHPFELFCQYQVDLKRRSPVASTACFGLTDGYGGYLPTLAASLGGGYSGTPFAWARFDPEVGHRFVDGAAAMLHALSPV